MSLAVILTAFLFALFHQPADLAHWVSFTATGVAYGWIRVASRSTTAGGAHACNLQLGCFSLRHVLSRGQTKKYSEDLFDLAAVIGLEVGLIVDERGEVPTSL